MKSRCNEGSRQSRVQNRRNGDILLCPRSISKLEEWVGMCAHLICFDDERLCSAAWCVIMPGEVTKEVVTAMTQFHKPTDAPVPIVLQATKRLEAYHTSLVASDFLQIITRHWTKEVCRHWSWFNRPGSTKDTVNFQRYWSQSLSYNLCP
jgi:hypothetical protein